MMRVISALALSFIATPAFAQVAPGAAGGSPLMSALPLAAIFFVFFFLVIRPQMKQSKQRQAVLDSLKKGDVVVSGGGKISKITKIVDDIAYVEIATGVEIKLLKSTIIGLYTKPDAVVADKKNSAVKNDNLGVSKNKVANDN